MNGPTWFEYEHWLDGGGTFLSSSDPPQVLRTMNTDSIREPEKPEGRGPYNWIRYISYQITAAAAAMHYEQGRGFEKEDEVPFSVTNSSNSISARLFEASGRIQFRGLEGNSRVIEYDYLYLFNCS